MVYVPERDDFFMLSRRYGSIVERVAAGENQVTGYAAVRAYRLAQLGILSVAGIDQVVLYGVGTVGILTWRAPSVSEPLLVNCLATARCPLQCLYCYADDIMIPNQDREEWDDVVRVGHMASAVRSMVAVITGGEPLYDLKRTAHLIRTLGPDKSLVLDTSGVGDIEPIVDLLREFSVHVRVSVDSVDATVNDRLRPIRRASLPLGTSSHALACRALEILGANGIPHSVQTVVSAKNTSFDMLAALRDDLVRRGVRQWVLHVVVPAGKAASRAWIRPDSQLARKIITKLIVQTRRAVLPIRIRVTGSHAVPDAVLLIDPIGRLCLEDHVEGGKRTITAMPAMATQVNPLENDRLRRAHARRYLNGSLGANGRLSRLRSRRDAIRGNLRRPPAVAAEQSKHPALG